MANDSNRAPGRREALKLAAAGLAGAGISSFLGREALAAPAASLVAAAKKEAHLNVITLPPDWANYGAIMDTFHKRYGIKITDANPNGSSAQELQAIRSLKGQSRAPDVVDVGPSFADIGKKQGLFLPYKVATWSEIPADMKDAGGVWYGDYFGVVSFAANRSVVKTMPMTWADLKKPEYKGMIALNGSPLGAGAAFAAVFAASLGNGGSLDDMAPGVKFFAELAKLGNLNPSVGTPASLVSGQTPIVINWDYLSIGYQKKAVGKAEITVVVPENAQPYGSYYCQAINKFAPNPAAAKLWEEFLYSDEGQILFLEGFAHPARYAALAAAGKIPAALAKELPPAAPYQLVKFTTLAQNDKAQKVLQALWTKEVKI